MSMNTLRNLIDKTDNQLLKLLNERAMLTQKIGKIKLKSNQGVYAAHREKEVLERLKKLNKGPVTDAAIEAIYREIMSSCISLEKKVRIAYLGPELTFTHQAAQKKFGLSVEYLACANISDVFTEVERGRCDYGVVPVENSTEGAVNYTLDMFIDSPLKICAELYLPIVHNLLSNCARLKSVNQIYSHPQAFSQCRLWLESNVTQAKLIPTASTAEAARYISEHPQFKNEIACIAGVAAAKKYKLAVAASSIEDKSNNSTRFIVIAKKDSKPSGSDRTSIVLSVKDRVGALHDMLLPFAKSSINLVKIESRPSKKRAWDYFFFVDFEGHMNEAKVLKMTQQLQKHCSFYKVLGSYPMAEATF